MLYSVLFFSSFFHAVSIIVFPDTDKSSQKSTIPLTLQMRAATAAALGGAAAHAKLLADQEHREMEYLVSTLVDTQVSNSQVAGVSFICYFQHSIYIYIERERIRIR